MQQAPEKVTTSVLLHFLAPGLVISIINIIFLLGSVSWSAIAFLSFVGLIWIIAVVLILYFEKLCCFARHRFLKHFLRWITRTKRPSKPSSTTTQSDSSASVNKLEEEQKISSQTQEYLWIAGQREDIKAFEPLTTLVTNEFDGK